MTVVNWDGGAIRWVETVAGIDGEQPKLAASGRTVLGTKSPDTAVIVMGKCLTAADPIADIARSSNLARKNQEGSIVEAIGIVICCAAAVAIIFTSRYSLPDWWAVVRGRERPKGYKRKADIGALVFMAIILSGVGVMLLLEKLVAS